ncbi:MAG: class I poly(R)-hydroxyalkanoic acid synthase [Tabrizicola sp.]|uniref:PHA/PHB synthase family protein n=1 Tax=Tabrizicola sp. TaxID=2005166 RepID=UPI0027359EBC|nr:class I poly(R)-hydroxyalkanoic acid synthase [Tabrizicola sp.]MDP3263715.1 class I poly(R)-hydroxyalkanoic acid synthase [Tabrizicola sp.]MDP3647079.1 class I poly(R)-hydroxyalkanoic acid synthase [Paracoccaceae bacterium]MDZ4066585.1 class I poly(R)-hydroxyalkanoic acid synthase [Tabrizicola sp.]
MTTEDRTPASPTEAADAEMSEARALRLQENLARMEELSKRLTAALAHRKQADPALAGPAPDVYMKAATAYLAEMMQNPARVVEHQVNYWGKTLKHYVEAQQTLAKGEFKAPPDPGPKDRRFSNPLWDTHPFFNFLKQQYLLNAEAVTTATADMETLPDNDRRRVEYFTRQIVDMMAPTNFLATNPDALEKAVATDGMSLVQGLENLVRDVEGNHGELVVTLADREAFKVGENLATTPGEVVYRNRMLELIQYTPTTDKVHKIPLLIFPPWINKFYIMDLKPQNSLIKWIVDQGFTLFVVSWVNPDSSYAGTSLDDYIRDGFLRAMAEVRRITGEPKINAVGYCIGGTTLGLTLAHLQNAGDASVNAATFFTTLADFSDPGEVGVFLNNDFVDGIERQTETDGILSKLFMARTFSFLRSNDLIYTPAIRSYMLGEAPPAFDLLYWNGDGTNLPARMAVDYLRGLCQDDGFALGHFKVFGKPVSLHDIKLPLCAIACETDHIAHWRGSFNSIRQMGSDDKTFILSESGHIAGIINPPSKDKYGHYTNDAPVSGAPEDWLKAATFHKGSWWPRWKDWLAARSGPLVKARQPADSLSPAPGTYVTATPGD